jgi:23S rRNA (guanine745-N1)-methyltransferase
VTALDDALPSLRCPHCGGPLARAAGAVACERGHSFDVARQGYLSLLAGIGAAHTGDTAEMVAARERFLGAGHFDPPARALGELVAAALAEAPAPALIVDLGAGPGWYLARVLDHVPGTTGIALDVSKPALRRAARAHPRVAAVACDAWRPLPLRDGVAGVVLSVFAPRDGAELARVLAPGGVAIVVTPAPAHLDEIARPLGLLAVHGRKDERLAERLAPGLEVAGRRELDWKIRLDRSAARDAAAMGPSAFHLSAADLDERVAALPESLDVTAAVTITTATPPKR